MGFSSSVVREKLGDTVFMLYSLNPVVGVIDGFRWAILGEGSHIYLPSMLISIGCTFVCLVAGIFYFRKTERSFADVI